MASQIFDQTFDLPFGIAPLGLTGLVWPQASIMHARAAKQANMPFLLSTLSTIDIETAAQHAGSNLWLQLYPPTDEAILDDLLRRAQAVGCRHLVITIDVPAAGRRPADLRNGLAIPPKIRPRSVWQSVCRPAWAMATLRHGLPTFANLAPYVDKQANMAEVADYIRTKMKAVVDEALIKQIRDKWPGYLIIKGITHPEDAERAILAGADGLIVSNHGGRQLDAAQASIESLQTVSGYLRQAHAEKLASQQLTLMADSGVESGVDIAKFLAHGAQMVFAGRAFLYAVAAHGDQGAEHCVDILRDELLQIMAQLHCYRPDALARHLV